MPSEEIPNTIDFRYISDVITPNEALKILKNLENSKNEFSKLKAEGYLKLHHISRMARL